MIRHSISPRKLRRRANSRNSRTLVRPGRAIANLAKQTRNVVTAYGGRVPNEVFEENPNPVGGELCLRAIKSIVGGAFGRDVDIVNNRTGSYGNGHAGCCR